MCMIHKPFRSTRPNLCDVFPLHCSRHIINYVWLTMQLPKDKVPRPCLNKLDPAKLPTLHVSQNTNILKHRPTQQKLSHPNIAFNELLSAVQPQRLQIEIITNQLYSSRQIPCSKLGQQQRMHSSLKSLINRQRPTNEKQSKPTELSLWLQYKGMVLAGTSTTNDLGIWVSYLGYFNL